MPSEIKRFAFRWWEEIGVWLCPNGSVESVRVRDDAQALPLRGRVRAVKGLAASKQLPGNAGVLVRQPDRRLVGARSKRHLSRPALWVAEILAADQH